MNDQQLGFVFPGQGSQSAGMLAELWAEHDSVKLTFEEAADSLAYDLWQLIQDNPDDDLNKTQFTQPALLAASIAIWRLWAELGGARPTVLAGHSLGEYSALVCAGVVSFADGLRLVRDRGIYMQEAVPEGVGAMAAILGLADEEVVKLCQQAAEQEIVSAANFNSPGQVVIAGHQQAVVRATELAKAAGAKRAMQLAVSVPSHCALMQEAAQRFAERMQQVAFSDAGIPILHNVDASAHSEAAEIQQALVAQLYQPVRWWESVHSIAALGVSNIIECGPGKVLAGLIKRIDRTLVVNSVYDSSSLAEALQGRKL